MSLSSAGDVVAVGAPRGGANEEGRARVLAWDGAAWRPRGADVDGTRASPDGARDGLGVAVALSGDGAVVAAGAATDEDRTARGYVATRAWSASSDPPATSVDLTDGRTLAADGANHVYDVVVSCVGSDGGTTGPEAPKLTLEIVGYPTAAPAAAPTGAPTAAPTAAPTCDEASWRDASLVCGACTVLVGRGLYENCDRYCAALGGVCVSARMADWYDTCNLQTPEPDMACDTTIGREDCGASDARCDALCECTGIGDHPVEYTPPSAAPTPVRCEVHEGDETSWCYEHEEEWLEKCRWNNCAGCDPCTVVGCDEWCDDRPEQWTEKCDWATCAACGPCAGDAGEFGQGDGDFVASGDEYGPDCSTKKGRDSKSWHRKDAPTKTCAWVERKPTKRCRKKGATGARALTECVRACASCPSEGACADDAAWSHINKKNKKLDCVSVARNAGRRCALPGAAAACKQTCGGC